MFQSKVSLSRSPLSLLEKTKESRSTKGSEAGAAQRQSASKGVGAGEVSSDSLSSSTGYREISASQVESAVFPQVGSVSGAKAN